MGFDIQLPQINAPTDAGKVEQIRSYLYQFAEQLKWALSTLDEASNNGGIVVTTSNGTGAAVVKKVSTFNELRDTIVESAEFVQAIAGEVKVLYDDSGVYVAQSDFGEYKEERSALLTVDEQTGLTLIMTKDAKIDVDYDGEADHTRKYKGCIQIGDITMPDEETKYGISIGQMTIIEDGEGNEKEREFKTSARFTSTALEFFDEAERKVAYIDRTSGVGKFYIENAEITSSLIIGGYLIDASGGGLAFTWVGRGEQ